MREVSGKLKRILAADYLGDLSARPLAEIRRMRRECETEESELSYARRLFQGRVDILSAVLESRRSGNIGDAMAELFERLPEILADSPGPTRSAAAKSVVPPSAGGRRGRTGIRALGAVPVDLSSLGIEDLERNLAELRAEEEEVSTRRRRLLERLDALQAELARRYREGEADVAGLLAVEF
ncbi:MAG: hypothetical protein WDA71_10970 [Actinomycetota bacterium]